MQQRRVGTISMGVFLLALGILLLYAQFNEVSSIELIIKYWPAIFFLLGAEVLFCHYLIKEEQKIRYDIFSILIILFISVSGVCLYSLTQIGIMPRLSMMISAQNYNLQLPAEEIKLDDTIRKIVVEAPPWAETTIRTGTGNVLTAYGEAYVTADTMENAESMIQEERMISRKNGDTIYLAFNQPLPGSDLGFHARITEYTLIIPGDRQAEISSDNTLEIAVDDLKNNWFIDGSSSTKIRVNGDLNLDINAFVFRTDSLSGNVEWNVVKEPKEKEGHLSRVQARALIGSGKYKINIISRSNVTVNKI